MRRARAGVNLSVESAVWRVPDPQYPTRRSSTCTRRAREPRGRDCRSAAARRTASRPSWLHSAYLQLHRAAGTAIARGSELLAPRADQPRGCPPTDGVDEWDLLARRPSCDSPGAADRHASTGRAVWHGARRIRRHRRRRSAERVQTESARLDERSSVAASAAVCKILALARRPRSGCPYASFDSTARSHHGLGTTRAPPSRGRLLWSDGWRRPGDPLTSMPPRTAAGVRTSAPTSAGRSPASRIGVTATSGARRLQHAPGRTAAFRQRPPPDGTHAAHHHRNDAAGNATRVSRPSRSTGTRPAWSSASPRTHVDRAGDRRRRRALRADSSSCARAQPSRIRPLPDGVSHGAHSRTSSIAVSPRARRHARRSYATRSAIRQPAVPSRFTGPRHPARARVGCKLIRRNLTGRLRSTASRSAARLTLSADQRAAGVPRPA